MGGSEQMGGREKGAPAGNSSSGGGAAMDGGKKVTAARGLGSTGHGSKNRGHQERETVKGTSDRPIRWPEDVAEAAVAMAGGMELPGARD